MEDCDYTIEIIIVPLKERIAETNFFFKINIPLLKELVNDGWLQLLQSK